jgi:hypothetical protein
MPLITLPMSQGRTIIAGFKGNTKFSATTIAQIIDRQLARYQRTMINKG